MTREIKVKFWNGKKMSQSYELIDLLYEGVPSILANSNGELDTNPKKLEKIITLEWTGLKDKNGKDVYEGDFVYLAGYGNYQAVFPFIELYEAESEKDIGEIIGNIYSNPELLTN